MGIGILRKIIEIKCFFSRGWGPRLWIFKNVRFDGFEYWK